ncbi:MAG: methyltransferase domain-containing protein [Lachnospiraceae bacterium]|nr:methyltransferase domain-containing protein [Lachnospiraceae bacterium]
MQNNYLETVYNTKDRPITKYPDQLAQYLVSHYKIRKGSRLVDVGCGRGDFLYGFINCGIDAIGLDGAETDDNNMIGCINLETDNLPFEDNSVDVVFTKSVLEHIHRPEKMLSECRRILKPGGRIIAMVPDWHTCMYIYYDYHTHVQPYTAVGLRDCLRMYGFKDVVSNQFYQLPIVWKYPTIKVICRFLQLLGPVKKVSKNKFYRFSRELMLLATGVKLS